MRYHQSGIPIGADARSARYERSSDDVTKRHGLRLEGNASAWCALRGRIRGARVDETSAVQWERPFESFAHFGAIASGLNAENSPCILRA
eukprot:2317169-Pyramimonas_sp.AAC.2